MSKLLSNEQLQAIKERKVAAWEEIKRLCNGGRWQMRIPADEKHDSDIILANSLADIDALLNHIEAMVTGQKVLREMNDTLEWRRDEALSLVLVRDAKLEAMRSREKDLVEVADWLTHHLLIHHKCLHMSENPKMQEWISAALAAVKEGSE